MPLNTRFNEKVPLPSQTVSRWARMMGHYQTTINENREGTTMKKIMTLGIDLTKSIFHLVGCDEKGKGIFRKVTGRSELKKVGGVPPCLIGIETCGNASY